MTGTFLTSVRYMYTHSIDSLPVHYGSRLAHQRETLSQFICEIVDLQTYTDLINSERPGLFGRGGLSGGYPRERHQPR